ncbi:NADPH-dependent FMN reductase [Paludibaculum fermentans]|uniref:NAD(P)H-dependent oxidoreductase n=1 Tax=Paludibaculum fermentans TaxID=1473598 RepID=A0A7S7SI39_PALFE|nr:NAD(P)H-dependent oxidoreductase [Paludibaculum fermentans]QOY85026.1 NAD(P)H-dependent oxidoreductase [Paludibaculum fermentans]
MSNTERPIKIAIVVGSVRPGNFTSKTVAIVADELRKHPKVDVDIIHPVDLNLPLPGLDPNAPGTKELQRRIHDAAAVILATPEYHGSFSSVIKLAIENMGFPSALAGKPVGLLGVAAGAIGAIKSLESLRGIVSHVGALPLPMPISIANVQTLFDADGHVVDPAAEALMRRSATNLLNYVENHVCPRFTLERLLREGMEAAAH